MAWLRSPDKNLCANYSWSNFFAVITKAVGKFVAVDGKRLAVVYLCRSGRS